MDMYLISLKKISICAHLMAFLGRELGDDREAPYRACCAGSPQWYSRGTNPTLLLFQLGGTARLVSRLLTQEQRGKQFPSCLLFPSDEPSF